MSDQVTEFTLLKAAKKQYSRSQAKKRHRLSSRTFS